MRMEENGGLLMKDMKPFLNDLIKRPEYTEYIKRRANLN